MTALILLSEFRKTEIELWRPVEGFPGYEVSNLGKIRSFWEKRFIPWFGSGPNKLRGGCAYILSKKSVVLSPGSWSHGYPRVGLSRGGKVYHRNVHRLVASAFVVNRRPEIATQINHISNVSSDNRSGNLEWCTAKENREHAVRIGVWPRGVTHGCAKLNPDKVREILHRLADGENPALIAPDYDVTGALIYSIRAKKIWREVTI